MSNSPLACLFLRYGHKCGRVEDTVVIVGGADARGDYLTSTMLLNLVTRQVSTKKNGEHISSLKYSSVIPAN